MTDTLIENSVINEILDITKYQLSSQGETDGSFSALFTNASNKAEQTQTGFIDTAVKSNTSSINKYALDEQKNKSSQVQNKKQNNDENNNINTKTQFMTKKAEVKSKNTQTKQNTKTEKNNQSALNSAESKTVYQKGNEQSTSSASQTPVSKNQQTSVSTDASPQNIDNSSLESSPVSLNNNISSDNENTEIKAEISYNETVETDIQKEIKELVENILITFDIPINSSDDNSINIEGIFGNSDSIQEGYDFVIQAVDEISSQIGNMNLSDNDKNKIIDALNKVKTALQNIDENFELNSDSKIISEAQKLLDNLTSKISQNTLKTDTKETAKSEIKVDEIKTNDKSDTKEKITNEDLKKAINEIKTNKEISDNTEIKELSDKLSEIISELEETTQNNQDIQKSELTKVVKDLSENIKNNDTDKISKNLKEISEIIDNSKTVQVKTAEIKDNSKEELLKPEINTENDKISEIVSKLKEFETTEEYSKLSDDEKKEIKETINKLTEIKNEPKHEENKKIVEEVKKEVDKIINTDSEKPDNDVKIAQSEQVDYREDRVFKKDNLNFSQNKNDDNKNNGYQKETVKSAQTNIDKTEYKTKENEIDTQNKAEIDSDIDLDSDNVEVKQNKISMIDKIKEDFLESIEYTKETPVVISVSDEVVKYALNENKALPNQMAVGNVTYDPANNAVTIKNVQNIAQNQQFEQTLEENNILNQIGNKLYQLKDSQKLNLVLRPDNLGRLSIELTSDKNGLTTNIIAQNENVRSYIEKNINSLRTQLTQAGVNVNTIQIKTAGQDSATTYDGNQNREFTQEENSQKQNQQFQQNQNQRQKDNESLAHLRNYDMHFAKDFSGVLDKTLSYMN